MDSEERAHLADALDSALTHLSRYVCGTAKDAMGELEAAKLLIENVAARLRSTDATSPPLA
jgi:hypothetical protein